MRQSKEICMKHINVGSRDEGPRIAKHQVFGNIFTKFVVFQMNGPGS